MAFCNSCGATLTSGTRFCNKCGVPVLASTPVASANPPVVGAPGTVPVPSTPASGQSNALKIVLIVVGVVVLAGMMGMAAIGFIGWRIAHHARVHQDGDNVKVETPFGTVESNKDPEEAARSTGVDLYPGAHALKEGAATANFAGVHTASAMFESSDSLDKVAAFYKSKYPNAAVTSSGPNHCSIVSTGAKNLVTINLQTEGDGTKIEIATVSHNSDSSSQ